MPLVRDHGVFQGLVDQLRAAALVGGMRLVGRDGAQVGIEQHLVAPRQVVGVAPVAGDQHRQLVDLVALAGDAQGHLEVLHLDLGIVEAGCAQGLHAVQGHRGAADVGVAEQVVEVQLADAIAVLPLGFLAFAVDVDHQGADAADFRVLVEVRGAHAQRVRQHDVVQVRRGYVVAAGVLQTEVQRCADALVLLAVELETVDFLQLLQHGVAVVGGTVVDDDHFEIRVVLLVDAAQGFFQVLFRVEAGRYDGYQRGVRRA